MSDQNPIIHEENFLKESMSIPQGIDKPEESASAADGITVINDSSYDVQVLVSNQILGIASSGWIRKGNQLVLPAGWAWWDVYVLYQVGGSHLFLLDSRVFFNLKKTMVGYRAVLKVSDM